MAQIPMGDQFIIGRGVNSLSGKTHNTAIEFDAPMSVAPGQDKVLLFEAVTSSRELTQKMSISASASLNMGDWGGSAGFKLTQSREINNYYTYALIQVLVLNPPTLLQNPRLKPAAKNKLSNEGWDAFAEAYGWEYIEGVRTGGSYYALIEIQTKSELQQQDVKGKLSAFYGPFGGGVEAETMLREIANSTSVNVLVAQSGGAGDAFETSLEEMLDQARSFPSLVDISPIPIIALTAEYKDTVLLPPVPAQNSLVRIQQKNTLEDLGNRYLKLRDYKANLEFILDNFIAFDDFRSLEIEELAAQKEHYANSLQTCAEELNKIVSSASTCTLSPNQCSTFVSTVEFLPLPAIEGELMNLKTLQDHLNTMRNELDAVKQKADQALRGQLQGLDITGDIKFGAKLTSTGRMHVDGDEHLFLLNKSGVIISKAWNGNGNLTVDGEIRGKLWLSEAFELDVPSNGVHTKVKMHPADKCIAFLTRVSGPFAGGAENVWLEVGPDGFWYLCGHALQGGIKAQARCAGMP
jgi:hypothetical protein